MLIKRKTLKYKNKVYIQEPIELFISDIEDTLPCAMCDLFKNNGGHCIAKFVHENYCGPTIYLKELKEGL